MAREERICINCVTPLKKESKQLGTKSVWWVCQNVDYEKEKQVKVEPVR